MNTITYAAHVALFDPMTGQGLLVLPEPERDLADPFTGAGSLHSADWDAVMRHLAALGIEPQEDDEQPGTVQFVGLTRDGREVLALYGPAITNEPSIPEMAEAFAEMATLAGLSS